MKAVLVSAVAAASMALFAMTSSVSAQRIERATFDGKPFSLELARDVAGNRTLIAWHNCSLRRDRNGDLFYPQTRRAARRVSSAVPCLYLITGNEDTFTEHFVLDVSCDEAGFSGPACMSGYALDTRIRNRITRDLDAKYQFRLRREFKTPVRTAIDASALEAGREQSVARPAQPTTTVSMADGGYSIFRVAIERSVTRTSLRVFDQNGTLAGPEQTTESYVYTAYSGGGSSGSRCEAVRDEATANSLNGDQRALDLISGLNNFGGMVIGTGLGALATAGSKSPAVGAVGASVGAVVGETAAYITFLPFEVVGIRLLGTTKAELTGAGAQAVCEAVVAAFGTSPDADNEPGFVENPRLPDLIPPAEGIEFTPMCPVCVERAPNQSTTDGGIDPDLDIPLVIVDEGGQCLKLEYQPCSELGGE